MTRPSRRPAGPAAPSRRPAGPPAAPVADALEVENPRAVLKAYYAGVQIPSPNGGFLMPLGVRGLEGGRAVLFLECSASSLRYRVEVPKATRTERSKVRAMQAEGDDPTCPRHGRHQRLLRVGKELVCPLCGVVFGKA